jgi:intermembrane space import and assembly protein 40
MIQLAARSAPRQLLTSKLPLCFKPANARRFLSTAPPSQKSRSWKGSAARWAIAIGAVYFYNTSPMFADQPEGKYVYSYAGASI